MNVLAVNSRECQFCHAWFSRVDASRRHSKTCPKREGRILLDRKRGRRARSCDQCSRVKVHCNARNDGPCERCIPRRLKCTFNRHTRLAPQAPPAGLPEVPSRSDGRIPLSSLLNFTDDRQDYLTEKTVGMEPDSIPLGPTCLPSVRAEGLNDGVLDCLDPSILLLFDHEPCGTPVSLDVLYPDYGAHHPGDLMSTDAWNSAMSFRLDQLEVELNNYAASSYDRSLRFDAQRYRSFFSVANVYEFITMFCRKRHYRYPIIHWPTFEAEKASLALLLVASLTGAAYSFDNDHGAARAIEARKFYKIADAYVFQQLEHHLVDLPTESSLASSTELCQAALLMYALDILPTDDLSMQRSAVATRLPMLISTLRRLEFMDVRHEPYEDWKTFVRREQMIRVVAWAFCADCLATLTCNRPPSFSIMEMRGDLPCDPVVWEAEIASFEELWKCSKPNECYNLKDLMRLWLNNDWRTPVASVKLLVFYLHIMLCAFHQVVFNSHVAMSLTEQSTKLLQALDTWRHLWDDTIGRLTDSDRKRLGVANFVSDLENLARRIIEVAVGPHAHNSRYLQRIPSCGTREIHEFMQNFVSKG